MFKLKILSEKLIIDSLKVFFLNSFFVTIFHYMAVVLQHS